MLKQHWPPFCHLLGNISACWSSIHSKKRKLQKVRRWWHGSNKMLSLTCHLNGTITVVLHLRLRPLCKWFSVQLSPWSGAFHFGISLLVAHFHFFSFLWQFPVLCSDLQLGFSLWTNMFIELKVYWWTYSYWRSTGGPIATEDPLVNLKPLKIHWRTYSHWRSTGGPIPTEGQLADL